MVILQLDRDEAQALLLTTLGLPDEPTDGLAHNPKVIAALVRRGSILRGGGLPENRLLNIVLDPLVPIVDIEAEGGLESIKEHISETIDTLKHGGDLISVTRDVGVNRVVPKQLIYSSPPRFIKLSNGNLLIQGMIPGQNHPLEPDLAKEIFHKGVLRFLPPTAYDTLSTRDSIREFPESTWIRSPINVDPETYLRDKLKAVDASDPMTPDLGFAILHWYDLREKSPRTRQDYYRRRKSNDDGIFPQGDPFYFSIVHFQDEFKQNIWGLAKIQNRQIARCLFLPTDRGSSDDRRFEASDEARRILAAFDFCKSDSQQAHLEYIESDTLSNEYNFFIGYHDDLIDIDHAITIGEADEYSDLCILDDPLINPEHLVIIPDIDQCSLEFKEETTDIYVDGIRVDGADLHPDSVLRFGSTEFKLESESKGQSFIISRDSELIEIPAEGMSIGSGPDNKIVLTDPTVSRNHASLKVEDDQCVLRDLGSATGTYVDGQIVAPISLDTNSIIRIGDTQMTIKSRSMGLSFFLSRDGQRTEISPSGISIGRSNESDVLIGDSNVSRKHAVIKATGDACFLWDRASTNGTYLDSVKLPETPLPVGSRVTIGRFNLTLESDAGPKSKEQRFFLSYDGKKTEVTPQGIVIGRSDESDIIIDDDSGVSRKHAVIRAYPNECVIRDGDHVRRSTNGVEINGQKMFDPVRSIEAGSIIKIGHKELVLESPIIEESFFLKFDDQAHEISPNGLLIGSDQTCDVILPDSNIESTHAFIKMDNGNCTIQDLGSTSGTYTNGVRVQAQSVNSGSVIGIGETECVIESEFKGYEFVLSTEHKPGVFVQPAYDLNAALGLVTVEIPSDGLSIGSGPDNDIILPDPKVNENHANLKIEYDQCILRDLGSDTGTYVDEQLVAPISLDPNSIIRIGDTELRIQSQPKGDSYFLCRDDQTIEVTPEGISIGTAIDNDILLDEDPLVDPYHARVIEDNTQCYLKIHRYPSNTYINGTQIGGIDIIDGSILKLGNTELSIHSDLKLQWDQFVLKIYSPIPSWIDRKWTFLGEKLDRTVCSQTYDCLFAWRFDKEDFESVLEVAQDQAWLQISANGNPLLR